ncbi:MAG TPA: hypothetical protein VFU89_01960 [Rhabdochlamydiaceae bacterium]|nr:hypothetical protein [Rhabdochlamydiaceae bacterium]
MTSAISEVAKMKETLRNDLRRNAASTDEMILYLNSVKNHEQVPFSKDPAIQKMYIECIEMNIAKLEDQKVITKEYEVLLGHPHANVTELLNSLSEINSRLALAVEQRKLDNIKTERSLKKIAGHTLVDKNSLLAKAEYDKI